MNNNKIYFISADYVKQTSPIMDDVENTLITQHILESQNIDLQECIGTEVYERLVNKLSGYTTGNNLSTLLTTDYELYDTYIKPFLVYKTIYYSFYDLYSKNTSKGLVNQYSNNSTNSSLDILEKMRKEYNIKAEHYKTQMYNFLNDNNSCNNCNENYTNGLYLGKIKW